MKKTNIQKMVMASMCLALGLVLPQLMHGIPQAAKVLLPMHLPVLLCGLICGWGWGFACGVLTPLLSSLIFNMPLMPYLPGMLLELAIYGLVAGLLYRALRQNLFVSLVGAMLLGRVAYGLLQTVLFLSGGKEYSMQIFFTGLFVKGLPGIAAQLILIPILVLALEKAGVIRRPARKNG